MNKKEQTGTPAIHPDEIAGFEKYYKQVHGDGFNVPPAERESFRLNLWKKWISLESKKNRRSKKRGGC